MVFTCFAGVRTDLRFDVVVVLAVVVVAAVKFLVFGAAVRSCRVSARFVWCAVWNAVESRTLLGLSLPLLL